VGPTYLVDIEGESEMKPETTDSRIDAVAAVIRYYAGGMEAEAMTNPLQNETGLRTTKPQQVYSHKERETMLAQMELASASFYRAATSIGNHPFIEFTGLMNEYIKVCRDAHANGMDFTQCNKHAGHELPMAPHQIDYVVEKLECIFTGRSMMKKTA
jgi:hypothetical protein